MEDLRVQARGKGINIIATLLDETGCSRDIVLFSSTISSDLICMNVRIYKAMLSTAAD